MFKKMKLREKVLFVAMFVSVSSLLSMTITSYFTIYRVADYSESANRKLGEKAIDGTGDALYEQAQDFLINIAIGRSNAADAVLHNIALNVDLLEGAVHDIFSHPEHYLGHKLTPSSEAAEGINSSTWMLSQDYEITADIKREIELLSNLDMITPTLKEDPNVLQLYIGTQNGLSYTYSSIFLDNPEFDPRERPWFMEAVKHPQEVVLTDVYESAFGAGMVLTAAKAIYGKDGQLIGVAGLDIKLEDLESYILDTRVADTGYSFIMDEDGKYIVHPDMENNNLSYLPEDDNAPFAGAIQRMMAGEQGFAREEVEGRFMYFAFSPMRQANWSVGVVVPEDEILFAKNNLSQQIKFIADQTAAEMQSLRESEIWTFMFISFMCILMIIIIGMYLTRIISEPIDRLTKDVANFGGGKLESRAHIETKDEIGFLAEAFNQMADNIVNTMQELTEATATKERLNSELRIAAQIQNDMLPDVVSMFADYPFINISAFIKPALEMGGDLYDVFFIDKEQRKICTVIADVSGKGVPSAMFMVMAKTLIRNYMFAGENPAEALRKANNHLCEDNRSNMFITVHISLSDLKTGECQYSYAGHNPIARCPRGGEFYFIKTINKMPLGLILDNEYPLYHTIIRPGDKFFLYTDGITEALNESDVQWGEQALLTTLNLHRQCPCDEIAEHIREGIAKHVGGAEQSDDITMLVLEYVANSAIVVKNDLNALDNIYGMLNEMANFYGFSQDMLNDMCVCMDEIFSNIVKYAYDDDGEHAIKIELDFDSQEGKAAIVIIDDGRPFNPLEVKAPDLSLNLLEREIGGLGIFIVSNFMNSVNYARLENTNRLEMQKII